jgi:hypothetical protein
LWRHSWANIANFNATLAIATITAFSIFIITLLKTLNEPISTDRVFTINSYRIINICLFTSNWISCLTHYTASVYIIETYCTETTNSIKRKTLYLATSYTFIISKNKSIRTDAFAFYQFLIRTTTCTKTITVHSLLRWTQLAFTLNSSKTSLTYTRITIWIIVLKHTASINTSIGCCDGSKSTFTCFDCIIIDFTIWAA